MMKQLAARLRRFAGQPKGNMAVEIALIAPVFLLMAAYLVDYGRALEVRRTLAAAAQTGAEYAFEIGQVTGNESKITMVAQNAAGGGPGLSVQVSQVCECPNGSGANCANTCAGVAPNKYAVVALSEPIQPIAWWPAWNGSKTLTGSMQVRLP